MTPLRVMKKRLGPELFILGIQYQSYTEWWLLREYLSGAYMAEGPNMPSIEQGLKEVSIEESYILETADRLLRQKEIVKVDDSGNYVFIRN